MNKRNQIKYALMTILATFVMGGSLHATGQPKFTIIPATAISITITLNNTATVQYLVTNQTQITRTLTMSPIFSGVTQSTSDAGTCQNPFTLTPGQSCLLTLSINGAHLPLGSFTSAIEICKTIGSGNNSSDRFLCSQTSDGNSLKITHVG